MTKTEQADLQIAIELLGDMRVEMMHGFERLSEGQQALATRVTVIEARQEARDAATLKATQRFRWAVGLGLTASVTVALFIVKEYIIPFVS